MFFLHVELSVVEKEYNEARNKVRQQHKAMNHMEKKPRIAYAFRSGSSQDTIDTKGSVVPIPGLRELPLG